MRLLSALLVANGVKHFLNGVNSLDNNVLAFIKNEGIKTMRNVLEILMIPNRSCCTCCPHDSLILSAVSILDCISKHGFICLCINNSYASAKCVATLCNSAMFPCLLQLIPITSDKTPALRHIFSALTNLVNFSRSSKTPHQSGIKMSCQY